MSRTELMGETRTLVARPRKARQRGRPVTWDDVQRISRVAEDLPPLVKELRLAGAGNAANYLARALKSTQGALNNAHRMYNRQLREAAK